MANKFLVSVAAAKVSDLDGTELFTANTLIDSSLELTLQNVDTRGGFGNKLLHVYYHSPELNITLTEATWNLNYLAAVVGEDSGNEITIKSDFVPKVVKVELVAKVSGDVGASTGIVGTVTITIPKATFNGNFTLSLTADGVANTPLTLRALDSEGILAELKEESEEGKAWYDDVNTIAVKGGETKVGIKPVVYAIPNIGSPFVINNNELTFTGLDEVGTGTVSITKKNTVSATFTVKAA